MNYRELVAEFHTAMSVTPFDVFDNEAHDFRLRLIKEEWTETFTALYEGDLVETADGLADLIYVLEGTSDQLSLSDNTNDCRVYAELMVIAQKNIEVAMGYYLNSPDAEDAAKTQIRLAIEAYVKILEKIAADHGIPIGLVFKEVHRSNMSKLYPDGKPRYRADGKVKKPDSYSPADIGSILENYTAHYTEDVK